MKANLVVRLVLALDMFLLACLQFLFLFSLMEHFKVGTLNVNGAREAKKRAMIYEVMKIKQIDVLFLQETHSDSSNHIDWRREWEGQAILSHSSTSSGGVGILFSKCFSPLTVEVEEVVEGRLIVVRAKFSTYNMVFMNIYAPTRGTDRNVFLDTICSNLNKCASEDFLFLGGDFNCTQDHSLDRNHFEPHLASQRALTQLVGTHGLVDVWRRTHREERQYTWSHVRDNVVSLARLDRFYCFKHHFNT